MGFAPEGLPVPPLAALLVVLLAPPAPPRLDADGIPLPAEAVRRLGSARFRHASDIHHMAVAPDGRTLVTASHFPPECLYGWDLPSGRPRFRVPLPRGADRGIYPGRAAVRIEDLSPEHRFRVTRYDPATGFRLGPPVVYPVTANGEAGLTPGDQFVITHHVDVVRRYGIDEKDHVLTVHLVGGGRPVVVLREQEEFHLKFLPGGRWFAAVRPWGSGPARYRVFETDTGKLVREITAAGKPVFGTAATPDGTGLAAVLREDGRRTLTVWDIATGRRRDLVVDPEGRMRGPPAFAPDGRVVVVSAGDDLDVRDARTGRVLRTFPGYSRSPWRPDFAPDGTALYVHTGDRRGAVVARLDLGTGGVDVPEFPFGVRVLRFAPGGRVYGGVSPDGRSCDSQVVGWDAGTGAVAFRGHAFPPPRRGAHDRILDVSPDGRWVAVHEWSVSGAESARSFRVCAAATGAVRAACGGHTEPVEDARFSADGARVYSRTKSERRAWDAATGRPLDSRAAGAVEIDPAVSPDGRMQARGGHEGRAVELVERLTGKVRHSFRGHAGDVGGFAFSPDGRYLASASPDAPVFVWDVRGELSKPATPPGPAALAAAWADLASGDAAAAFRAVRLLAHFPDVSVPFLRGKLPPVKGPTAAEVAKLVAALDAPAFADREAAQKELAKLGELAGPALREALAATPSAEVRARAGRLLAPLDAGKPGPEQRRAVRAVEAVEWMGTAAAKALLAEWAGGAAGATLTAEATAAAGRLR